MEKIKLKVAEFAEVIGCTPKSVYKYIDNEQLNTVDEIVNGRKITFVLTDENQINEYRSKYSKAPVRNPVYEDILTTQESEYTPYTIESQQNKEDLSDIIDRIITLNNGYNEKLSSLNERLITAESKQLLLEDKANREGLYLKEINELKAENNSIKKGYITVIIVCCIIITALTIFLFYKLSHPTIIEKTNTIEKIVEKPVIKTKR